LRGWSRRPTAVVGERMGWWVGGAGSGYRRRSIRFTLALAICPATNVAAPARTSACTAAGGFRLAAFRALLAASAPGFSPLGFATTPLRLPVSVRRFSILAAFAALPVRVTAPFWARIEAADFPPDCAARSFCWLRLALERAPRDPPVELKRPLPSRR
jgi:hypothetical protein